MALAICNYSQKKAYLAKLETQIDRVNRGENLTNEEIKRLLMENQALHSNVRETTDSIYIFNEPFKSDNRLNIC
jgi:hypothetical protein